MNERRQPIAQPSDSMGVRATPGLVDRLVMGTPLAAAIVSALYPASAALAQQTGGEGGKLEEVIVTATRRELSLQNVPQSVAAFTTADIEKQAFRSVEDVIGALPSVSLINNQPGRNNIVMRGISTGSDEFYTDSQVSIYVDDQPMTSNSQQVEVRLIDLERIEAMPGPQGTLFGSSSQAGTIRYITNKPDPTGFSAQLDGELGTTKGGEESYDVSGHLNFPLSDNLAVRVVGFYSKEGGYVDNVLGPTLMGDADNSAVVEDDWNDYSIYGGRVAARWQINPNWESTLSLITQSGKADGVWESDPELGDYKVTRFFDEWRDDDWYQASLNAKGDLGFAELSATASYFDRDTKYQWDNANYSQWRSRVYGYFGTVNYPTGVSSAFHLAVYNTGYEIGPTFNWQKQERWAYEVRLTSKGESRFQWLAGAFYEDVWDWWHYGAELPGLMDTTAWERANIEACGAAGQGYDVSCPLADTDIYYQQFFDRTVKQKAVFGEMSYDLTEKWSVTGGARWFEYDREEQQVYNVPAGLPVGRDFAGGGRQERSGKDSDTVFKASTQYKFDDDRMVYALYSEGFRLGGSNSARAAAAGVIPLEYLPDTLQNYEAGLKSQWFDDSVLLNVTLFYMQWDKIQRNTTGSNSDNPWWMRGTFNAGKAEQKGVEIVTSWRVTDHFSLDASATLADPEFTEDAFYPNGEIAVKKGLPMPISPEEKYWLSAEYTIPHFMGLNGDAWTRASYSYTSEIWNSVDAVFCYTLPAECVDAEDFEGDPEGLAAAIAAEKADNADQLIPSWTTTTLQFGFTHDDGWEASLVVRNLFDEQSVNWLGSSDYGADFGDPRFRNARSLQRPRSISLSFTKKW